MIDVIDVLAAYSHVSTTEVDTNDQQRPGSESSHSAVSLYSFSLDEQCCQQLHQLAQSAGVNLSTLLLAAFQVLLHRQGGQEEIRVRALRTSQSPWIALRAEFTEPAPTRTFFNVLEQTRTQWPTNVNHSWIDQITAGTDEARLAWWREAVKEQHPLPELTLLISQIESEITLSFAYRTDRFSADTIISWSGHYLTLLSGIVRNPSQSIATLPLLTPAERQQVLVDWNDTRTDWPGSKCVHRLFEEQVELTPDAVAVVFQDQQLSYWELNLRANQLAHYLVTLNVGPAVLVGVYLNRSVQALVGILAILKAGGAYVPLDPTYPAERLHWMLNDSQLGILLTQQSLLETLPQHQAIAVCLDMPNTWQANNENPTNAVTTQHPLYVMYTSGSTGQPKGVRLPHRALSNLIHYHARHATLSVPSRTLQFAPISFDVSCQEMFSTLCLGGTLVLIEEQMRRDPIELLRYLNQQSIERLFLPFVALQQLTAAADAYDVPPTLREIVTAGEQLVITPALTRFFRRTGCLLHNHYGPTECHVVTAFTLSGDPESWPSLPPIGRPIANCQLYLLDRNQQPIPAGATGELYIGGSQVADGYHNRPDITAQKFLPNRFGLGLLYRTGDLARYLPDGNVEYLGRIDGQIKIRGYRIELGEIEAVLAKHRTITEAVVIAHETTPLHKQLIAYLVPHSFAHATDPEWESDLRGFLAERLPDYMLPAHFVVVPALPLTPSGKVDRQALPKPTLRRPMLKVSFVPPQNRLEEQIAAVWEQLLHLDRVGTHDNFFELGGNSLLLTQMQLKLTERCAQKLSITELLQFSTVHALAERIAGQLPQTQARDKRLTQRTVAADQRIQRQQSRISGGVISHD